MHFDEVFLLHFLLVKDAALEGKMVLFLICNIDSPAIETETIETETIERIPVIRDPKGVKHKPLSKTIYKASICKRL